MCDPDFYFDSDFCTTTMTAPIEVLSRRPFFLHDEDPYSHLPGPNHRPICLELYIDCKGRNVLGDEHFFLELYITNQKGKVIEDLIVGSYWCVSGFLQVYSDGMTLYDPSYRKLTKAERQRYFL